MNLFLDNKIENKIKYIICNVLLVTFDSLTVLIPIILGYLVDTGLKNENYSLVLYLGLFLILFVIIITSGSVFSVIKLDGLCHKMSSNLKRKCYKKLNEMDTSFYQSMQQGEIMTIMTSDIGTIRMHYSFTIKTVVYLIIRFVLSFVFLFYIHPIFTLILLIPTPFILFFSLRYKKVSRPLYQKRRDDLADLNNYIQDNIEGNKVVKAFSSEESEIKDMKSKNNQYKNDSININDNRTFYFSFVNLFTNCMTLIFAVCGGIFLIDGSITFGNFIVFQGLLSTIKAPFLRFGDIIDRIQNFIISKERVVKLLTSNPVVEYKGNKSLATLHVPIKFDNVKVSYDNNVVINDINLEIKPGSTIAFIGPTGSGKSSIINLLLGFVKPSSGNIFIGDTNMEEIDIKWLRSKIGFVSQQPFLFSDTIKNNICYGNANLKFDDILNIQKVSKLNYVDKLEDGFDTIIGERGVGLSGGEKQRLSLARALAVKPELLILDDITSALDIETEQVITENIKKLNPDCTKVIIAQKIVSVKDADQIFVVNDKNILEYGTHAELLEKKGYYFDIYKIQNNLEVGENG